MVATASVAALLAFAGYPVVVEQYGGGAFSGLVFVFILSACVFLAMRLVCSHYEDVAVARLVRKGNVGVARVVAARPLGEARDVSLRRHLPWELELEVYVDGRNVFPATVREDVAALDQKALPGHVFVTFAEGAQGIERLGVVPTFVVYASPSVESVVRRLEKRVHPKYLEVRRTSDGLAIAPFASKKGDGR